MSLISLTLKFCIKRSLTTYLTLISMYILILSYTFPCSHVTHFSHFRCSLCLSTKRSLTTYLTFPCMINPLHACIVRVTVCQSVCLSPLQLTPRWSLHSTNDTTHSAHNENQALLLRHSIYRFCIAYRQPFCVQKTWS